MFTKHVIYIYIFCKWLFNVCPTFLGLMYLCIEDGGMIHQFQHNGNCQMFVLFLSPAVMVRTSMNPEHPTISILREEITRDLIRLFQWHQYSRVHLWSWECEFEASAPRLGLSITTLYLHKLGCCGRAM